jgi:hypothetical protein
MVWIGVEGNWARARPGRGNGNDSTANGNFGGSNFSIQNFTHRLGRHLATVGPAVDSEMKRRFLWNQISQRFSVRCLSKYENYHPEPILDTVNISVHDSNDDVSTKPRKDIHSTHRVG